MEPTEVSNAIKSEFKRGDVVLSMPRFKIEYSCDRLQKSLKELKIFAPGAGDFGGLFLKVSESHWRARPPRESISSTIA